MEGFIVRSSAAVLRQNPLARIVGARCLIGKSLRNRPLATNPDQLVNDMENGGGAGKQSVEVAMGCGGRYDGWTGAGNDQPAQSPSRDFFASWRLAALTAN
jgi:hypothetical protein